MQLSEHLTLAEVTISESAKRFGLTNQPTSEHLANLKKVAEHIFEPIRNHFRCPILISSGYRSQQLNNMIGGVKNSHHLKGMALDLDMDGAPYNVTNKMIFDYIRNNLKFTQVINEFDFAWIHVSYDETNLKNQVLISNKINGRTTYENYK